MTDLIPEEPPRPTDARLDELIDRWFDDDLDAAESAELEAVLLRSPASRRRFWKAAEFHADVLEAASLVAAGDDSGCEGGGDAAGDRSRRSWVPAAALAGLCLVAGGGLGTLLASRALAGFERAVARVGLIAEDFEAGRPPLERFVPAVPGVWSGDGTAIVEAAGGVAPRVGTRMLEFQQPMPAGGDPSGEFACELWRLIPVDEVRSRLRPIAPNGEQADGLVVEFSAAFNQRLVRAGSSAKSVGASIYAFHGRAADAPVFWKNRESAMLASSRIEDVLDGDPETWQRLRAILAVPPDADFLLVHCYARDHDRRPGVAFDGQYVDDLRVAGWIDSAEAVVEEESP